MSASVATTEHTTSLSLSLSTSSPHLYIDRKKRRKQQILPQNRKVLVIPHSQRSLLSFIRHWKERHLRPDSDAPGCLPDDVSSPVLPQVAEHYGKCAAFLASLRSDEGVVRRRVHRGASGL